jgi:diguanylate cyclase (GGDEF)-like protein/PAS domain S-box-containing protein
MFKNQPYVNSSENVSLPDTCSPMDLPASDVSSVNLRPVHSSVPNPRPGSLSPPHVLAPDLLAQSPACSPGSHAVTNDPISDLLVEKLAYEKFEQYVSQLQWVVGLEILDAVPLGVAVINQDFEVVFWNTCLESWTGLKRRDLMGKLIFEFFPSLQANRYIHRLNQVFRSGLPAVFSSQRHPHFFPCPRLDSRQRILHTIVSPLPGVTPDAFNALIAVQDVTDLTLQVQKYHTLQKQAWIQVAERERAEESLLRERDLLNGILETSVAAIVLVDLEGNILFCNSQAKRLLNLSCNTGYSLDHQGNLEKLALAEDFKPLELSNQWDGLYQGEGGSSAYDLDSDTHDPNPKCPRLLDLPAHRTRRDYSRGMAQNINDWPLCSTSLVPLEAHLWPHRQVIDRGQSLGDFECSLVKPGQPLQYVSINAAPLRNTDQDIDRIVLSITDITARRQSEARLRSQAHWEHTLNTISQSIRQSLRLKDIFTAATSQITDHLNLDEACILRLDGARQVWVKVATYCNIHSQYCTPWVQISDYHNSLAQQLKNHKIVCIDDLELGLSLVQFGYANNPREQWMMLPLWINGSLWGSLNLIRHRLERSWQDEEVQRATAITDHLAIAIQQAELYQQLEAANRSLLDLALLDPLTQIANRRHFTDYLEKTWKRLQQKQEYLSLILVDVDYFKAYNDSYGHQAGDLCLQKIAMVLSQGTKRPGDLAARYGGEEFVLILPRTNDWGAYQVGDRLRREVEVLGIPHGASPVSPYVTISVGLCTALAQPTLDVTRMLYYADQALYRAKAKGRNQVVSQSIEAVHLSPISHAQETSPFPQPSQGHP